MKKGFRKLSWTSLIKIASSAQIDLLLYGKTDPIIPKTRNWPAWGKRLTYGFISIMVAFI